MTNTIKENNEPIMCYEKFSKRDAAGIPRYNNFIEYFRETLLGSFMRESSHYQRFQTECPDLDTKLRQELRNFNLRRIGQKKSLDIFLYAAYVIMKTNYGASDGELIGGI